MTCLSQTVQDKGLERPIIRNDRRTEIPSLNVYNLSHVHIAVFDSGEQMSPAQFMFFGMY